MTHTFTEVTNPCTTVLCKNVIELTFNEAQTTNYKERDDYLDMKNTSLIPTHRSPVTRKTKIAAHGSTVIFSPGIV